MQRVRGTATAVVLTVLVAAALAANARLMALNIRWVEEADGWVSHTHEVAETLQGVLLSLLDAETAERGFILTGDEIYLEPYSEGRSSVPQRVSRLSELTSDNPTQLERIAAMRPLIDEELSVLERGIAVRRSGGLVAAQQVVRSGGAKGLMDSLRVKVAAMDTEERRLLEDRARDSAAAIETARMTNWLGLGASLFLLVAAFGVWRLRTRERGLAAALLNEEKEKFRTTLTSIGDGVVVTDHLGRVTLLNRTAASLLAWSDDAIGKPLDEVFRIVNEQTRAPVESRDERSSGRERSRGLANHTVLIRRDGSETPID